MKMSEEEWLAKIEATPKNTFWLQELRRRFNALPQSSIPVGPNGRLLRYKDKHGVVRDVKTAFDVLMHIEHLSYNAATARLAVMFPDIANFNYINQDRSQKKWKNINADDKHIFREIRRVFDVIGDNQLCIYAQSKNEETDKEKLIDIYPSGKQINSWNYKDIISSIGIIKYYNYKEYYILAKIKSSSIYKFITIDRIICKDSVLFNRTNMSKVEELIAYSNPNICIRKSLFEIQIVFIVDRMNSKCNDITKKIYNLAKNLTNKYQNQCCVTNYIMLPGFANPETKYVCSLKYNKTIQEFVKIIGIPYYGIRNYICIDESDLLDKLNKIDVKSLFPGLDQVCEMHREHDGATVDVPPPPANDLRLAAAYLLALAENSGTTTTEGVLQSIWRMSLEDSDAWHRLLADANDWRWQ